VKKDSRMFPKTLLAEHKKGARTGAAILAAFTAVFLTGAMALSKAVWGLMFKLVSKQ
jgi:hypothetical protein